MSARPPDLLDSEPQSGVLIQIVSCFLFILFLHVLDCLQVQGCSWHGKNNNKSESVYLLLRRSNPAGCCSRTANVESFPKSKLPHPLIERSGSAPAISRHLGVPSGASKTISEPLVRSTKTVLLSRINISTISK